MDGLEIGLVCVAGYVTRLTRSLVTKWHFSSKSSANTPVQLVNGVLRRAGEGDVVDAVGHVGIDQVCNFGQHDRAVCGDVISVVDCSVMSR